MADTNIALGVQVPDAMKNISGMLNFANQAQNLQRGNVALQQGNVALEKERIILGERKGIQDLFKNPEAFNGPDGQPDYNKLITEGMKIAPTTFPTMVPQIIQAHRASIDAKAALNTLNNQQRDSVGQFIGSLGNDDPETARKKLDGLVASNPQLKTAVDFAWNYTLAPNANDPAKWKDAVMRIVQSVIPPASQVSTATPSYVSTGGSLQQTNPMAAATGAPASLPVTLPPGSLETTETGPDKQQYIVTRSPQGTILGTRSLAGGPQGGTGAAGGMPKFNPGDAEAVPILESERNSARQMLSSAPIAHETNRGILSEIDKVAATGSAGPAFQRLLSTLGVAFNTPEEKASAYDVVGKYLERNAIEAAKAMGPNTNAGLEASIKANGSVAYNPTAIKKITKLNDAIVSGAEMYSPGLEKAIAANPQRGVLAKREFDQLWAQNFDPRITMINNAVKAGDQKEVEDILKQVGGRGSKGAQELIQKARNLDKLSAEGRL